MYLGKLFIIIGTILAAQTAFSADAEQVDVEGIKKKYWASGDENQLGVVQNRMYSKARKFSLGIGGGFMFNDPFLTVKAYGGTLGYHINEFFGVSLVGYKFSSSPSAALTTLRAGGKEANTNPPNWYTGAEGTASLLYGKLSLVGASIIYFDLHFSAGAGLMDTESGRAMAGTAGMGQRFYISRVTSLRIDYRMIGYKETIIEKEITTKKGQAVGDRTNLSHSIFFGFDFLLGKDAQ